MKRSHLFNGFLMILAFFFGGCADDPLGDMEDDFKTINIADSMGLESDEARVFLLPAPLQIASALKIYNIPYYSKLISDPIPNRGNAPEYLNALNLGMNTIDMGYATVYGDFQSGLDYSNNIRDLMDELGIRSAIKMSIVERFENNIDRQDSLCKIILDAYGASHEYFQHNQREGVGLLILTGCFIEGLYLTANIEEIYSNKKIQNLVALHKEYAENLLLLLGYYKNSDEIAELIEDLEGLKDKFQDLNYAFDSKKGKAGLRQPISRKDILRIKESISALRSRVRYEG